MDEAATRDGILADEFADLDMMQVKPRDFYVKACSSVFESMEMLSLFLSSPADRVGDKHYWELSGIVTEKLSVLASGVIEHIHQEAQQLLRNYTQKLDHFMRDVSVNNWPSEMLTALRCFLMVIPETGLIEMTGALLKSPEMGLDDPENRRLPLVLSGVRRLGELGIEWGEGKLSRKTMRRLFKLCESVSSEDVCKMLSEVLVRSPNVVEYVDKSLFTTLLDRGDEMALLFAAALVSRSSDCRRWLVQWCTANKKWRKRSTALTYLGVVFSALQVDHGTLLVDF